jgi:hypothetical protein
MSIPRPPILSSGSYRVCVVEVDLNGTSHLPSKNHLNLARGESEYFLSRSRCSCNGAGHSRAQSFAHDVTDFVLFALAGGLGRELVSRLGIDELGVGDARSLVKVEPVHSPFLLRSTAFSALSSHSWRTDPVRGSGDKRQFSGGSSNFLQDNAGNGSRTRTPLAQQGILSPWCLPFHHPGET